MTKDQFIKELEHIAESGSNEIRLGNLFDLVIAQDRESRWISVKERLPEESKEILVWSDRYGRTFATLTGQNKHGSIWLYSGNPIVTFNAPSHWQPLPESPKTLNL